MALLGLSWTERLYAECHASFLWLFPSEPGGPVYAPPTEPQLGLFIHRPPGVLSLSLEGDVNQTAWLSAIWTEKLQGSLPCLPRTLSLLEMGHGSDSSVTVNLPQARLHGRVGSEHCLSLLMRDFLRSLDTWKLQQVAFTTALACFWML